MSQDNLNVEQLLAALQRKGIPLPFELGTFLVLQAAEQALVLEATEEGMAAPPLVGIAEIWLTPEGEVSVVPARTATSEQEACQTLVVVLGDLLVRSAPGVSPMLLEIVEHGPSDGQWSLMRLRDDLEAALVPLNRGALRRVLSRLLREVRRDVERSPATKSPDLRTVDRDLDALFGIENAELPESVPPSHPPADDAADERSARGRPAPAAKTPRRRAFGPELEEDDADLPEPPTTRLTRSALSDRPDSEGNGDSLDAFERESTGAGGGARVGVALAVAAVLLVGGFLLVGRDRARSWFGIGEGASSGAAGTPAPAAQPAPKRQYGELRVTSTPDRAQVLLFVGTGPAMVSDLPVGVAHEFVAMADGKSPSRSVVPPNVPWQLDGARQRYELALQLDDAGPKRPPEELGPTRLPENVGTPTGATGDVRVVTSPPGAKVYQLVGFTPDVRVENVELGKEPLELIVYLADHVLARRVVRESDFKDQGDGRRVADIDVQLTRRR